MAPANVLGPPLPVLSVKLPKARLPLPARLPKTWPLPRTRLLVAARFTDGAALKLPSDVSVSVPPPLFTLTLTLVAAEVAARRLLPTDVSVPAPSAVFTVPPFRL